MCIDTHREKEKGDTFGLKPTERATVLHSAIYSTLNGFFLFTEAEKTKKRGSGEAGRRGAAGPGGEGAGMTAAGRRGGRRAAAGGGGEGVRCSDNQSM